MLYPLTFQTDLQGTRLGRAQFGAALSEGIAGECADRRVMGNF